MKKSLINGKVLEIYVTLKRNYLDLSKYDKRFNFAVSRTLQNIEPICKELLNARKSEVDKFNEFEEKRMEILKKYVILDDNGNLISKDEYNYLFKDEESELKAIEETKLLSEDYKDAIEERRKEVKIYNEILEQEVEVDIIQCKFETIPDKFDFNTLRILIKETDEEIEAML